MVANVANWNDCQIMQEVLPSAVGALQPLLLCLALAHLSVWSINDTRTFLEANVSLSVETWKFICCQTRFRIHTEHKMSDLFSGTSWCCVVRRLWGPGHRILQIEAAKWEPYCQVLFRWGGMVLACLAGNVSPQYLFGSWILLSYLTRTRCSGDVTLAHSAAWWYITVFSNRTDAIFTWNSLQKNATRWWILNHDDVPFRACLKQNVCGWCSCLEKQSIQVSGKISSPCRNTRKDLRYLKMLARGITVSCTFTLCKMCEMQ